MKNTAISVDTLNNPRNHRDQMLRSEDVAEAVWEAVNKPGNVYIEDVMIKDHLQSC